MAKYTLAYFDDILKQRPLTLKERKALSNFKHAERVRVALQAWRKANPDKVAEQARRKRQRKLEADETALREQEREHIRLWRVKHPDYNQDYAARNPDIIRVQAHRRRALEYGAEGSHTAAEVQALLEAQKYLCANPLCRRDLREHHKQLDHVKALSKGGTNYISNLQWLCRRCNASKHDREHDEWLECEVRRAAALLGLDADEVREAFICQSSEPALECSQITEVA